MLVLKKQENDLIEQLTNQAEDSQQMKPDDFELIWFYSIHKYFYS